MAMTERTRGRAVMLRSFEAAIVADAVFIERQRIRAAIMALDDDCHDTEGLGCSITYLGPRECYSLQRADVLAIIDGRE